jgi:glycerol uptake facilitator-like aquaporin
MKISQKNKAIGINILGEFIGSTLFSLMYFTFIARYLDSSFEFGFTILAFFIGAAYFAAVYVPFHTYRIHIIPFISIIRALQKKRWRIIYNKIPAQIIGAFFGTWLYKQFMIITHSDVRILDMWEYKLEQPVDILFFNLLIVLVLCYTFYILQLLFKNLGFTSTFFFALVVQVVFIFTWQVSEITALNVFGYLSLILLEGDYEFVAGPIGTLFIHVLVPSGIAYGIYFYIRDRYIEKSRSVVKSSSSVVSQNYDV